MDTLAKAPPAVSLDTAQTDVNTGVVPVTLDEIVGHAITFSKIMSDEGTEISKEEMDAYFEQVQRIFDDGMIQLLFAARALIEGRSFKLLSDNPQTIMRIQSLAQHMGATVTDVSTDKMFTRIVLAPPSMQ